jgi:hypothetical protein
MGLEVEMVAQTGHGIDDYLMEHTPEEWWQLGRVDTDKLKLTKTALVLAFDLEYTLKDNGGYRVPEVDYNIRQVLSKSSAFDEIWYNEDEVRAYVGEKPINEFDLACIFQSTFQMFSVTGAKVRDAVYNLADNNRKSPFRDWVKEQEWDGVDRLETWMIDQWGVADTSYAREVAKKMLVGAVARLMRPGCKLDWMVVVVGPQGIGKTYMPQLLWGEGHVSIVYGNPQEKDLIMQIQSGLVTIVDEMDAFSKREATYWKSMLSCGTDTLRLPYDKDTKQMPRNGILYGTGNHMSILQADTSGHRRYAILAPTRLLDFNWLREVRAQLWAEAWHCYVHEGVRYWEIEGVNEVADQYVVDDPKEDLLREFLSQWCLPGSKNWHEDHWRFTMADVHTYMDIGLSGIQNATLNKSLSALLMEKFGCTRHKSNGVRHYRIKTGALK